MLTSINFLAAIWIFFLVFTLHEVEEWNIDQFEHRNFVGLSPAATDRSARMWIGFVVLVGLIWCTAATLIGNPTAAAWIILPAIAIMLQNGLQHVFWVFYFRQYAPGVVTAVFLMIPLGSYMIAMAIKQGYVPTWYLAIWMAVVVLGFIQTVRAGNKMTPLIRSINEIGIWLSGKIR
jgi:hypothetical protein